MPTTVDPAEIQKIKEIGLIQESYSYVEDLIEPLEDATKDSLKAAVAEWNDSNYDTADLVDIVPNTANEGISIQRNKKMWRIVHSLRLNLGLDAVSDTERDIRDASSGQTSVLEEGYLDSLTGREFVSSSEI